MEPSESLTALDAVKQSGGSGSRNHLARHAAVDKAVRVQLAQVRLRVGDHRLTAVITRDAVDELKLKRGQPALAIVKSTEVMIARSGEP